ncbi:hypothetical protein QL285_022353 [Trifolium repens]|nr:hypothetical protein QL285_022353 [Trifolium repens]
MDTTAKEQEQQLDPAAMDATAEEQEQHPDPAAMDATAKEQQQEPEQQQQQQQQQSTNTTIALDNLYKNIIAGGGITRADNQYRQPVTIHDFFSTHSASGDGVTADFMAMAKSVPAPFSRQQYPSSDASHPLQVATGKGKAVEKTPVLDKAAQRKKRIKKNCELAKSREHNKRLRKAAEENLELDEAALQNQEQERIRNNESDASRREEQQALNAELERLAKQFDKDNKPS